MSDLFFVQQIFVIATHKIEASVVSSVIVFVFGRWQGVLLAALRLFGALSAKHLIICCALAMDSDISKVHIFYVIVSWLYFPFGSNVLARMELHCVLSLCFMD